MIWFSGLPHAVSAAVVPVMAVSLMKCRRSIGLTQSVMTGQAVVGRLLFLVAVHTERHVNVHGASGDGLLLLVAVTSRTRDFGADVRRVVELHVRLRLVVIHPPPVQVEALLRQLGQLLDER